MAICAYIARGGPVGSVRNALWVLYVDLSKHPLIDHVRLSDDVPKGARGDMGREISEKLTAAERATPRNGGHIHVELLSFRTDFPRFVVGFR